jgi:crotonobetainyl-CoA:carnitine CoA-transferase CaiB-like acyl-CoA transferase
MGDGAERAGMLGPYRVLDLADEQAALCGKLFADLGAEVIKIEPPQGHSDRLKGPFYKDERDPEKSLHWFAYNAGKKSVTLDLGSEAGRGLFRQLVATADFLVESTAAGHLEKLGLGYESLRELNPGLIMVSVSPFGSTGPYSDHKGSDLVLWAMGGYLYPFGDPDRPPVGIGHVPQSYLHASGEAVVGALLALNQRAETGKGQYVDVSIQESVARLDMTTKWDMLGIDLKRGEWLTLRNIRSRYFWPCKDGYVIWVYMFGPAAERQTLPFIQWVEEDGITDTILSKVSWTALGVTTEEELAYLEDLVAEVEEPTIRFLMRHTKKELMERAIEDNVMLYPVADASDIVTNEHLQARGFWTKIEHKELGTELTYPGPVFRSTEAEPRVLGRAPFIGEHNGDISRLLERKPAGSNPGRSGSSSARELPLKGLKVADFCWAYVGPITTKLLADMGARVIKIEGRSRPDVERVAVPPFKDNVTGFNRDGHFNAVNTSKMSVALNLATPRGVDVALRLAAWADVVIDNFAGGAMRRMGLSYERIREVNPGVIMMSSAMLGQNGPHMALRGFGQHLTALTGFNQVAGYPDRGPSFLGYYTDFISPHINQLALLAALDHRRRIGSGMYMDACQIESCLHFMSPVLMDYLVNGRIAGRLGNRHPEAAPHGVYRCDGEDRWCAISVMDSDEWRAFCEAIERDDLVGDPRFDSLEARKQNEDELDRVVEAWTSRYSAEDVMSILQQRGVAAGVARTGQDLYERDPQLKAHGFYRALDHPEVGEYRAVGPAFTMSAAAADLRRAPLLGEHNEYALKEILRMSDDDIAQLVIEGILE